MKSRSRKNIRSKRSKSRVNKRSNRIKRSKPRSPPRKTKSKCQDFLRKKIRTNMKEYKDGMFSSREQAIAVSYSQTKEKLPYCSRYFKLK
jgi:hypothetical protein